MEHCAPNEVDLHGLTVPEATARADQAIEEAKRNGASNVRVIVGVSHVHLIASAPHVTQAKVFILLMVRLSSSQP